MLLSDFLLVLFRFLIPPALIGTTYIYTYPFLHECSFPEARAAEAACLIPGQQKPAVPAETAPFRLLAIGDPQLEGDTSLPNPYFPTFSRLEPLTTSWSEGDWAALPAALQNALIGLVVSDIPRILYGYRKRIDLWGNDYYLAHIYRGVYWWSQPTHTTVLGDLLGSQWISDAEFHRRSDRFWHKVFRKAERVPNNVTDVSGRVEVLGEDPSWPRRLIAVAGNHDVGYAGDLDERKINRFEDRFGRVNWELRFRLNDSSTSQARALGQSFFEPKVPEIRLIILNSMNLDEPALYGNLQHDSRNFVTENLHTPQSDTTEKTATVLLTHIPLYKPAGICTDGPLFTYFTNNYGHGIQEQNQLSEVSSKFILDGLAGEKKKGRAIILNGHDHEGCHTYHSRPRAAAGTETGEWSVGDFDDSAAVRGDDGSVGIQEVTVRSMMGSYGGNIGMLSGWFDKEEGQWKFKYASCQFWTQHVWWFVHVLDLIVVLLGLGGVAAIFWEVRQELKAEREEAAKKKKES